MTASRSAVVTGVGVFSSLGVGAEDLFSRLMAGERAIAPPERFSCEGLASRLLSPLVEFDAAAYLGRRHLRMLDRSTRTALSAVKTAIESAGEGTLDPESSEMCGIVMVTTYTPTGNLTRFLGELLISGARFVNPLFFANTLFSTQMMHASIRNKLRGIAVCLATGETGSIDGLIHAERAIRSSSDDLVVVGGAESMWLEFVHYFESRGLLLAGDDASALRPYDANAAGAVLGEAAAALVVEARERAEERGAQVLAELLGAASRTGSSERALGGAIKAALRRADCEASDIDAIIGAGNGAAEQDALEARVLSEIFESSRPLLTSIKGAVGECTSVSGLLQLIVAIEAGRAGKLPATCGLETPRAELAGVTPVMGEPAELRGRTFLLTSIGHLGGAAAAIVRVAL